MTKDMFRKLELYLEEEYFRKKDFELLEKLKTVFRRKVDKESIREATGVTNEQLLDRLVSLNLDGELMAAFQLYPLVEIAWADGDLTEAEAEKVLEAGLRHGLRAGSKPYAMLEERLRKGPDPEARKIWFLYADELRKTLTPDELARFRDDMLERARAVVAATTELERLLHHAGERRVLDAIEAALTPPSPLT